MKKWENSLENFHPVLDIPTARLEKIYHEFYLKSKGHTLNTLDSLDPKEGRQLRIEACRYASLKLAEVETRARLMTNIKRNKNKKSLF